MGKASREGQRVDSDDEELVRYAINAAGIHQQDEAIEALNRLINRERWLHDLLRRACDSHSPYCGCESCEYVKVGPTPPPESFSTGRK